MGSAPGKKVKVKGKKKTCDDWAELGKCDSTVKNESFTVSSVCEQSCNACPAAPTGPTLVPCTDTTKKNQSGRSKRQQEVRWVEEKSKRCMYVRRSNRPRRSNRRNG